MNNRSVSLGGFLAALLIGSVPSQAGFVRDLAFGLGAVGVDYQGDRNPFSGGIDFLATTNFTGNQLDFGTYDLSLQGPLSMAVSTGGRALSELEFSFRTAPDATSAATPLSYQFNLDTGAQQSTVSGTALIDASMKINGLGFYDLSLTYSSRQTIQRDGVIVEDSLQRDFDLGPVVVSGNIVADILTVLTDPIYERTGGVNPFAQLSGRAQLQDLLDVASTQGPTRDDINGEAVDGAKSIADAATSAVLDEVFRRSLLEAFVQSPRGALAVVPEPRGLVYMSVALGVVGLRKRSRRSA